MQGREGVGLCVKEGVVDMEGYDSLFSILGFGRSLEILLDKIPCQIHVAKRQLELHSAVCPYL